MLGKLVGLVLFAAVLFGAFMARRADESSTPEPFVADSPTAAPATPVLSARRYPAFLAAPASDDQIVADLEAWLATAPQSSCAIVQRDGRDLLAHRPDDLLSPASAQKLLTAAAALDIVGADATFTTSARSVSPIIDGVIDGDLWLVGGGDPIVATADYVATYDEPPLRTDIDALADALVAAGLTEITGGVIADETRYDTERYVAVWPPRFAEQNQTGPLGAMTINDAYASYPPEEFIRFEVASAANPAEHAAALFDDLLEARGVVIRRGSGVGERPPDAVERASVQSPAVERIVTDMLAASDNATAELLLKEIGLVNSSLGTTSAGADAVEAYVAARELDPVVVADGSGLAVENQVSCRVLVDLLNEAEGTALDDGLPVAGETGTLRRRYVGTDVEGHLRAKTGTLNDVTALAGFVDLDSGETLTFALIVNNEGVGLFGGPAFEIQDGLAEVMVDYGEDIDLSELGPATSP